jgi:radical SAM protein with 4Fe4S-binding SPASM domain
VAESNIAGRPIDRPGALDCFSKIKTRIINPPRRKMLRMLAGVNRVPLLGGVVARVTRQFVGPTLHALKLEVNSYCNQQCRICYLSKGRTDLPRDVIATIARDLAGYSVNIEIIGGEPLLRDDIAGIVHDAKFLAKSPRVSLYTNGTLATPALCADLKKNGLDAALVTLHSHNAQLHDSITGEKGSWEKSVAGIRAFKAAGIKVYVATVVHRENFATIKETGAFVEKELGGSFIVTKYIPDSPDSPYTLTSKEWREVRRWLIKEQKAAHMREVESFFTLTGSCPSGNYIMAVKADGTVQPCPFATGFTLGKVPEQRIWEIYEKRFTVEKFQQLKKIPNQCDPCVLKHLCGGGCRSASYGVFDGICGKDPLCGGPFTEYPKDEEVMEALPIHF